MYLNKAMVFGNLTRDPELRSTPGGQQVCSFGLATNRVYKKPDGSKGEQTEFHNVVAWGRLGETCAQYLRKGSSAYVEGRLQTRNWDKDGVKQYKTEIIAETIQFGPKGASQGSTPAPRAAEPVAAKEDAIDYPADEVNPDDIPF